MRHAREDHTYRGRSPLGWAPPHRVVDVVEAIVTTQRDHGNREDRHPLASSTSSTKRHRVDA